MKTKIERQNRILARGEVSGHCHVIIGEKVLVRRNNNDEIIIEIGSEEAVLRHILEFPWVEEGKQVWTKEHKDIPLKKGTYRFIQQIEYDPYLKLNKIIID
ncbi:MAG: hypothetical protein WCO13_13265 [Bacteroidota bacterium]